MKFVNKEKGLKGLILIAEMPKEMKRNTIIGLFICVVFGLFLLIAALLTRKSGESIPHYLLYFFSGVYLTMAYIKFTEFIAVDMVSTYLDKGKAASDLIALGIDPAFERKIEPAFNIKKLIMWLFIAWLFYYLFSQ